MLRPVSRAIVALLPLVAACAKGSQPLTEADRAALRTQNETTFGQYVVAKNFSAWAGLYTADAAFMPPNEPAVNGRAAIETWAGKFPSVSAFSIKIDDIGGAGDLAYVRGTYAMTFTPPGAPVAVDDHGKFLQIERKQADGSWQIASDVFNSDVPLAPPPTPARK